MTNSLRSQKIHQHILTLGYLNVFQQKETIYVYFILSYCGIPQGKK